MLRSVDLGGVAAAAPRLGWRGGTIYLLYSIGVFGVLGAAWWTVARGEPPRRILLFAWARMVREAAADLLPFSQLGGLIYGARTLTAAGVPGARVTASMAADMTTEMASQALFTLFGLATTASLLMGSGAALRPAVLGGSVGLLAIAGVVLFGQRPMLALGRRLSQRFAPGAASAFAAIEAELAAVYADRRRMAWSFALNLAGWIVAAAQAWVLLRLIGVELPLVWAIAIEALVFTVRAVAFAVPGALGFQEAAYVVIGPLFGLPAETALVLALAKRGRDVAIGVPVLAVWHFLEARSVQRTPDR